MSKWLKTIIWVAEGRKRDVMNPRTKGEDMTTVVEVTEVKDLLSASCKFVKAVSYLTLNRPGFLQIGMAREGQILPPPPPCNFCFSGPIDLTFGMQRVLGKISRHQEKIWKKIAKSCSKC